MRILCISWYSILILTPKLHFVLKVNHSYTLIHALGKRSQFQMSLAFCVIKVEVLLGVESRDGDDCEALCALIGLGLASLD
jgi:hypothetical protein